MKYPVFLISVLIALVGFKKNPDIANVNRDWRMSIKCRETPQEPWTSKQLMAPADLAAVISNPSAKKPVIICIGPGALIKGSINIGPTKEKENLEKFKKELSGLRKDADIVIYCGCCPFEHCPNIRPAFTLLNEMKFTNSHLLNLEHNLGTDWVAKGYPQEKA